MIVRYNVVLSLVAVTLHWETRDYRPTTRLGRVLCGLPATLFTLLFGWWGVPWGPIRAAQAIALNLAGGVPVPPGSGADHA
jgi:hypothetical protein